MRREFSFQGLKLPDPEPKMSVEDPSSRSRGRTQYFIVSHTASGLPIAAVAISGYCMARTPKSPNLIATHVENLL